MRLRTGASQAFAVGTAPMARLGGLLLLAAAVLMAKVATLPGGLLILALTLLWMRLCGFQSRNLWRLAAGGLLLFTSILGSLALAAGLGEGPLRPGAAWSLALKGVALAGLSWATLATFRLGDLLAALGGGPGTLRLILEQIIQQVRNLLDESRRIAQAWQLRGGSGRLPLALLRAAPMVWLPRVAHRAERVAAAMDLRGIPGHGLFREPQPLGWREGGLLGLSLAGFLAALALRWGLT